MDKRDDAPSNAEPSSSNNGIISTSFNQDQGCFACGTENGFKIFNSFPFKDSHQRSKSFSDTLLNIFRIRWRYRDSRNDVQNKHPCPCRWR